MLEAIDDLHSCACQGRLKQKGRAIEVSLDDLKPAAHNLAAKYRLKFVPDAWREWQALDGSIKQALKPPLAKRLQNPMSPAHSCTRIGGLLQDQTAQARLPLVYVVEDDELVVLVLSVGKREDNTVYLAAAKRVK